LDGDVLADALDVVIVEVFHLEDFLDEVGVGRLHHATKVFAVEAAPVLLAHVALRSGDSEGLHVMDVAANLHAAVAGFARSELDLKLQLKILVLLLAAQKRVEFDPLGRRRTDDGAVLDAPELIDQAFPAGQILAVEELLVAAGLCRRKGEQGAKSENPIETLHDILRKKWLRVNSHSVCSCPSSKSIKRCARLRFGVRNRLAAQAIEDAVDERRRIRCAVPA